MSPRPLATIGLAVALAGCGINSIPTAEENAKARWADVQNDYQRRADLIPNLVATVKAAGAQEKDILTQVTQARASATQVKVSGDDLTDPAKVAAYERAQNAVSLNLQRLQEAGIVEADKRSFESGSYYHVFSPADPHEVADEMQRLLNDWYAMMGQLIAEFREKYDEFETHNERTPPPDPK